MRMKGLRDRAHYRRLVDYLKRHYPMLMPVGRFAKWSLTTLKNTSLGIGGIFLFVVAGLYVTGALIEPLRWYLVGIATALLLLGGGLLALSYARFILNRFVSGQHQSIQSVRDQSIRDRTQLKATIDGLKKTLTELKKEISDSQNTMAKMNVGNFALFQRFNRRLTNEDLKRFAREWAPKLGLDLDTRALAYIAHRICLAEDTCVGRLGGHIETMLLRVLVARSVREPNLEVLEIGTLFGVGAAMIHENCRSFFNHVHITIIDPLSGYYGSDQLDIITRMPVTRDIFVHNMQRMSVPEADYTIIEKLSTEDEAREQASKKRYNLLIIDGDHSYSGVKHDFHNYRHLVKRSGYIVFDDYDNPSWPEVRDFVDGEVVELPQLEFVGTDVHSAVFRVVAPQDLTRQSATPVATITTKDGSSAGAPSPALTGRDTAPNPSFDYPKQVAFETLATCNAHCDLCPQSKLARRGHIMPMELIEKIVSELSEIPSDRSPEIAPNGVNEPLADKRIFDILNLISSKLPGTRIYFVTNGNLLSEEAIAELSKHNLSKLCISLNFCDKKTYEQRTGLQWEKTLAAMSILHAKVISGQFRHPVHISRVQDGSEYDTAFAEWVGVNYPAFQGWLKRPGDWLGLMPNLSPKSHEVRSKCPQWHIIHIASTGAVRLCCMDADAQYPWGNAKTMNLLDIFNQDEWSALRRGQRSRLEVHPCNKCTYY